MSEAVREYGDAVRVAAADKEVDVRVSAPKELTVIRAPLPDADDTHAQLATEGLWCEGWRPDDAACVLQAGLSNERHFLVRLSTVQVGVACEIDRLDWPRTSQHTTQLFLQPRRREDAANRARRPRKP